MENFDPRPQEVKEKSFYILHLDTPRIIILTSVIIGIIIAAFLFGMSFMKGDKSQSKELTLSDMEFNESKGGDLLNKEIPQIPGDGSVDPAFSDKTNAEELKTDPSALAGTGQEKADAVLKDQKQVKDDVLKNENISEIIPPADYKKSSDKKTKTASKASNEKAPKKVAEENNKNKDDRRGKSRIYEVSKEENNVKNYDAWSVQVASYDTLSKAEKEKSSLKAKSYDAYIDRTVVNGRNFFRVRIGPLASKRKASELVNELQSDSRYSGSYMVKE